MYQIRCFNGAAESYIYDPRVPEFAVIRPQLALESNKSGMLTFSVPDSHPNRAQIIALTSDIVVYEDGEAIFYGRSITNEKDFYKTGKIVCEGELAFLYDSIYRSFDFTGTITEFLTALIANHNAQAEARKEFTLGTVSVVDTNGDISRSSKDASKTLDVINSRLINTNGGYLRIRHEGGVRYLDYLADYGVEATQKIEFSKNLIDLTQFIDATKIRTVLIPYGAEIEGAAEGERLTVASINGGLDYITNAGAVALYGQIWETVIFDDVTIADNLMAKALVYLGELVAASLSLNLTAIDLSILGVETRISIGDWVQVISAPHGLDALFLATAQTIDLANPESTKISFGNVKKSFTTINNQSKIDISKAVDEVSARILRATQLITGAVGGYVVFDPPERPSRILIMDTPDKDTAENVWQWNVNGLGFSSTGINGVYGIAITMDGKINAEFILAGQIAAARLIIGGDSSFDTGYDPSTKETPDGAQSKADAAYDDAVEYVAGIASDLQSQIDGNITTYFYAYEPSLVNLPSSDWTTTDIKNNHLGDLFYDTATGYSYRFQLVGETYSWTKLTDSDVTEALALASAAQDTADGKRRVFVATPTTPYDVGDLWAGGSAGDLKKCKTQRLTGAYNAGDWELASKYTDDTAADLAQSDATQALSDASAAQSTANTAASNATTALNSLADITADNKVTAIEKQLLKKEWDVIVAEKTVNDTQADAFTITTEKGTYGDKYGYLNTYINTTYPLFTDMTTTVTIDAGTTLRTKFKEYYDARTGLLNAIASKAKLLADTAQTAANLAQANIDTASISTLQTSDAMVTSIGATCYSESMLEAEVKGLTLTNLAVNGDFSNGTTGWTAGNATHAVVDGHIVNTGNGAGATGIEYSASAFGNCVTGDVLWVRFKTTIDNNVSTNLYYQLYGNQSVESSHYVNKAAAYAGWVIESTRFVAARDVTNIKLYIYHQYADAATESGKKLSLDDIMVINLTARFGAGNEPTAAQMDLLAPTWFDGTVNVVNPEMVNVGKNLFDYINLSHGSYNSTTGVYTANESFRSTPKNRFNYGTYILSGYSGTVRYIVWDSNGALLSTATFSSGSFTVSSGTFLSLQAATAVFTVSAQFELGSTATTREAYKSNTFALTATLRSVFDTATLYRDRLYRLNGVWKIDRYVNPATGALQAMATENAVVTGQPKAYKNGTFYYNNTVIAPRTEYTYALNFRGAYGRLEVDTTAAIDDLADISNDAKVTPVEKLQAKQLWDAIVAEANVDTGTIKLQATAFGVSSTLYLLAYVQLDDYLNDTLDVFGDMTTTTAVVRDDWDMYWNNYYNRRTIILNSIATKNKDLADGAQGDATSALGELANIASDAKITPVEKLTIKPVWESVIAEAALTTGTLIVQAAAYGIDDSAFDAAYAALYTLLTSTYTVFANMGATTTIVRATWDSAWKAYADARTKLINDIASVDTQMSVANGVVTAGTLQVSQGGTVAAGVTGNTSGDTAVRFWAGETFANRGTAPYRVTQEGVMYATNAQIGGTGTSSTGIGVGVVSTGEYSIAIGETAEATDDATIAIGYGANASAQLSSAIGYGAVASNTSATAIGVSAEASNIASSAIGANSVASGIESTAIGASASATHTNATAIGKSAASNGNNTFTLGNSSIATLRCQVTSITALSDRRYKKNIKKIPSVLEFIKQLKPISFRWNKKLKAKYNIEEFGFIAQDLQDAQKKTGILVPNLVSELEPNRLETAPGTLIPVLVKAIQEQQKMIEQLQIEVKKLKQ